MVIAKDEFFSIEPVGVYSSLKMAKKNMKECQKYISPSHEKTTAFEVVDMIMNKEASFIQWYREATSILENETKSLMDKGYIDQLIGEDGEFYYTITEKGEKLEKYIKSVVPNVNEDMDP
jgi:hypothetical protein